MGRRDWAASFRCRRRFVAQVAQEKAPATEAEDSAHFQLGVHGLLVNCFSRSARLCEVASLQQRHERVDSDAAASCVVKRAFYMAAAFAFELSSSRL